MNHLRKLRWRLTAKFIAGTLSGLAIVSLFFMLLFLSVYRNGIESAHENAAERVSQLLETSLKQAMLEREIHRLQPLMDGLAAAEDLYAIRILNPAGEIRFSSDSAEFGQRFSATGDPGCRECHDQPDPPSTLLFRDKQDREVLRAVKAVKNQPECTDCHPPVAQQPVNDLLMVDYDGSGIQAQARRIALMFVGAGAVVFALTLAGGTWFMRRFVLHPVSRLHEASRRLMAGDWETRVQIRGNDEFSELGRCFNEMTDQLQQQLNGLREKDAFLQALVDAVPDGLRVIDADYRIRLTNAAYRRQLGLDTNQEVRGPCFSSSHQRESPCPATLVRCPHEELARGGDAFKSIHRHVRTDGRPVDVEVYAAPMDVDLDGRPQRLVVESIRDLKEQARFSHEQKLSELGQLAAGVAHEVFNPLSAAKMKLDATLAAMRDGRLDETAVAAALDVIDGEIARSMETADRLLKLSRFAGNSATLVDVNLAVSETLSLLNHEAAQRGIAIEQQLSVPPVRAVVNDSELRLAVLNLVQNAFHAMPEGGKILVRTIRAGGWTQIAVEDSGIGIPDDVLPHIFEPFFARRATDTKSGAGLGLAISLANIQRHGGHITVASRVGEGTRFTVSLPDPDTEGAQ
jgi:PAS domain S-box-containing protein